MPEQDDETAFDADIERFQAIWRDILPKFLDRMELRITPKKAASPLDITMVLRPRTSDDQRRVMLNFVGVMVLRFNPGSNVVYFSQLEIERIIDREYEGIADSVYDLLQYKVFEMEQDSDISFFCERFDVAVI